MNKKKHLTEANHPLYVKYKFSLSQVYSAISDIVSIVRRKNVKIAN